MYSREFIRFNDAPTIWLVEVEDGELKRLSQSPYKDEESLPTIFKDNRFQPAVRTIDMKTPNTCK